MNNKGFADIENNMETSNDIISEKPLEEQRKSKKRVDINILRSKLQKNESKELKKNLIILTLLILSLGILGIYLSL